MHIVYAIVSDHFNSKEKCLEVLRCAVGVNISFHRPYSSGQQPYITNEPLTHRLPLADAVHLPGECSYSAHFWEFFLGSHGLSSAAQLEDLSVTGLVHRGGPERDRRILRAIPCWIWFSAEESDKCTCGFVFPPLTVGALLSCKKLYFNAW